MSVTLQVVIDCADPATLAEFWARALAYEVPDPPGEFDTWPDFLVANGVPEEDWNMASAIEDPDGDGPRVFLQRVPEAKEVKNRLHLDLRVVSPDLGGDDRMAALEAEADRLVALGAARLQRFEPGGFERGWLVLADPEGNEFCLS